MLVMVLFAVLVLGNDISVYAAGEVPDLDRKGSITILLQDKKNQKNVSDGELTLYQIAELKFKDEDMCYEYTNGFEGCGIELNDLEASELAGKLRNKISNNTNGITKRVNEQGMTSYTDLALGLYLIVQTKDSEGYEPIQAFLVSVPLKKGENWIYDVDATPKVETLVAKPTKPSETPKTDKKLPQTGQLNWPIPFLSFTGLLLFALGWCLTKEEHLYAV